MIDHQSKFHAKRIQFQPIVVHARVARKLSLPVCGYLLNLCIQRLIQATINRHFSKISQLYYPIFRFLLSKQVVIIPVIFHVYLFSNILLADRNNDLLYLISRYIKVSQHAGAKLDFF